MLRQKGSVLQMTAVLCIPKQTEDTLTRGRKKKERKIFIWSSQIRFNRFRSSAILGKSKISDDKRGILNDVI